MAASPFQSNNQNLRCWPWHLLVSLAIAWAIPAQAGTFVYMRDEWEVRLPEGKTICPKDDYSAYRGPLVLLHSGL